MPITIGFFSWERINHFPFIFYGKNSFGIRPFWYKSSDLERIKEVYRGSTVTQLSVTTDSIPFSVPSYFLYPHLQSKASCWAYVRNDITCSRAHNLESSELSSIWLRFQCHTLTKFICAVYLSSNSSDYIKFFDYLTSKVEYILPHFPYAEGITMFTTSFGFDLLSLTNLVNKPSTLLSFMT